MKSKIDARVAFKLDTGESSNWLGNNPHWYSDSLIVGFDHCDFNTTGSIKSIYGKWLEDRISDTAYNLRMKFQSFGHGEAIRIERDYPEIFKNKYSEWLEEIYIEQINKNNN